MPNTKVRIEKIENLKFKRDNNNLLWSSKNANIDVTIFGEKRSINISWTPNGDKYARSNIDGTYRELILINGGIDVDETELIELYKVELEKETPINDARKIEVYGGYYDKHLTFDSTKVLFNDITMVLPSKEEFLKYMLSKIYSHLKMSITYKGEECEFYYNKDNYSHHTNVPLTLRDSLTRWNSRKYGSVTNLAKKYKLLVDFNISKKCALEQRDKEENKKIEDDLKILKKNISKDIYIKDDGYYKEHVVELNEEKYIIKTIEKNSEQLYRLSLPYNIFFNKKQMKNILKAISNE